MDKTHRWRMFLVGKAFFVLFYVLLLHPRRLISKMPQPHTWLYTYGFHVKWVDIVLLRYSQDHVNDAMITSHWQLCCSVITSLLTIMLPPLVYISPKWNFVKGHLVMKKHGYWKCPITLANLVQITPSFVMNLLFYALLSLIDDLILNLSSVLLCTTSDDD